jgi:Protein of unknown function (DUF1194)
MSCRHGVTRRRVLTGPLSLLAADVALAQTPPRSGPRSDPGTQASDVDLNLALAVDASGSINQVRFDLQKQGYAAAFSDRQVLAAILSGPRAAISVTMYQWTGPGMQAPVTLWSRISDQASVERFATAIQNAPRVLFNGGTSVSGAIDFGVQTLASCPFKANRRVIDISGDGANNRGRAASLARDDAIESGININGLPILELEPDLEAYYRDNVIGGAGAFVIAAATFQDFATAIRRKLILEIAHRTEQQPSRAG